MEYKHLITSLSENIFLITINRPDKLNALNREVFSELNQVLDEVYQNGDIKSVIITGSGQKAFAAGADIAELSTLSRDEAVNLSKNGQQIFFKIENSPKPIVAAINGYALGGGCELAMSCHFRTASDNAKFAQPEVNLGLIPGYGGTQRLVQLIGKAKAIELLISAKTIDSSEALELGLVNYIFPADTLIDETKKILGIINTKAPQAIAGCIKAANKVLEPALAGYLAEAEIFGQCFSTDDTKEGIAAFLEKRKPLFTGN